MGTWYWDVEELEIQGDLYPIDFPRFDDVKGVWLEGIMHKKYANLSLAVVRQAQDAGIDLVLYNRLMGLSEEEMFFYYIELLEFLNYRPIKILPKRQHGVDIILNDGENKVAARVCKYKEKSMESLQSLVSGAIMHDCRKTMIIGLGSHHAIKLARANNCIIFPILSRSHINNSGYSDYFYEIAEAYECSKRGTTTNYQAMPTVEARVKIKEKLQKRTIIKWYAFLAHAQKAKEGVVLRRNGKVVFKNEFAID